MVIYNKLHNYINDLSCDLRVVIVSTPLAFRPKSDENSYIFVTLYFRHY